MATRLPVVLTLRAGLPGPLGDLAVELAGALMALPGCDISLIGALEQISATGTDRLMLEGLTGDFVIITDESPDKTENHLRRLELIRKPHELPVAGIGRQARILQITPDSTVPSILGQVKEIWQARQIQVVSIGALGGRIQTDTPGAPRPIPVVAREIKQEIVRETAPSPPVSGISRPSQGSKESLDPWLDSLVDRLDGMDL